MNYKGVEITEIDYLPIDSVVILYGEGRVKLGTIHRGDLTQEQEYQIYQEFILNGGHRKASQASHGSPSYQPSAGTRGAYPNLTITYPAIGPPRPILSDGKPPPHAGIRAGEIEALRCWRIQHYAKPKVMATSLPNFMPLDDTPIENLTLEHVDAGYYLMSAYMDNLWIPHKPMEGDIQEDGVHAFKEYDDVCYYAHITTRRLESEYLDIHARYYNGSLLVPPPKSMEVPLFPIAFGKVALWGEVIEHDRGYRAQYAKVISIDSVYSCETTVLRQLKQRYE